MGLKLIHLVEEVPGEMVTEALSTNLFVSDIISQMNLLIISIMFIFDTCHCNWAAVKSVHYEQDSQRLTLIIMKNGEITERRKLA